MNNNKKLLGKINKESTNREILLFIKNNFSKNKIYDSEIKELLVFSNSFKDNSELIIKLDNKIKDIKLFKKSLIKILDGYPIQYLIGEVDFLNTKIKVNKNVLIPRVETEYLCDDIVNIIKKYKIVNNNIIDVCTGSGCIALSLKNKFSKSKIYGSDISLKALNVAKENMAYNRLNIDFVKTNKCDYFIKNKIKFDILVSNPPYVGNKKYIKENVLKYEPQNAVYIFNGLEFFNYYFENHNSLMNDKFMMAFEIGFDQKVRLEKLIKKYFKDEKICYFFKKDIYNKYRYLYILRGYNIEKV